MRALMAVFLIIAAPVFATPVDTGALLRELVDLRRLADFPDPAYKTVQFSSYDRRSTEPGGPEWFANSDGFGNEPIPNFEAVLRKPNATGVGEYLICDLSGPGAIVRTWTARIGGDLRVYFDGEKEPVYNGPAEAFLLRPYDSFLKGSGVDGKSLDGTLYQRNAAYAPMPFAKGCRIVWTGDLKELHFYEVQIRQYAPGASVTSFSAEELKRQATALQRAVKILAAPDAAWEYTSKEPARDWTASVPAGERKEVLQLPGPGALERLTLRLSAPNLDHALRQTVLHIFCDGLPWAQVQSPVGDFFGAAPGVNPFDSVPFTVHPDGTMTCRYTMPFAKELRVVLENLGNQPVDVTGSALPIAYVWNAETSMHFRARWRADNPIVGSPEAVQDMPYLIANGRGVYVGTALHLLNPNEVPTPGGNWWGEGDEKIFVDDDIRPSTFGTGSEDYFNYAWSSPDIFLHPYCGQPRNDGPANRGFVTNFRWHILDPLPFQQRLAFYMELFPHERTPGMSYARIAYHYAAPGLMDDHLAIQAQEVVPLALPATWTPAARGAASDSVFYPTESLVHTQVSSAFIAGGLWEGGKLWVWKPLRAGDELELRLPVAEDGKYRLHLCAAYQPGSGRFSLRLDGKDIGLLGPETGIDLANPHRVLARELSSHDLDLEAGDKTITLRFEGGDSAIGLDFLWLRRR